MKRNHIWMAGLAALLMFLAVPAAAITLELTQIFAKTPGQTGAPMTPTGNTLFEYTPSVSLVGQGAYSGFAGFGTIHIFTLDIDSHVIDLSGGAGDIDSTNATLSFNCTEGGFLAQFAANGCGNYSWGDNFVDETTLDYSNIDATRTLGGDDTATGAQTELSNWTDMTMYNFNPSGIEGEVAFILSNRTGGATEGDGFSMTFVYPVPVPAAVWLFGSAVGLLGWMRRRT